MNVSTLARNIFWFSVGAFLGIFFLASFLFIVFQRIYAGVVYPGVLVDGVSFGGKKEEEVRTFFEEKNRTIDTTFVFTHDSTSANLSAKQLELGYDADLLAKQALSIGRGEDIVGNVSLVFQAYVNGIHLSPAYRFSDDKLETLLSPTINKLRVEPVEALFQFQNGRVVAFRPSSNGQEVDLSSLKRDVSSKVAGTTQTKKPTIVSIPILIRVVKPKVTTDRANTLGIRELIGTGTSLFQGSIQNRIFNITLASARLNGSLVAPGEVFSFNNALGDVSSFTGYKQAFIIQGGKTILGDGGGVCQVSTTFFRSLLQAGLPVVERHAHSYRVGYYEQDSPPGFDATVYSPSIDLRFKNDTGNYVLIQALVDPSFQRLTFSLYGTSDARQATITKPLITNQVPAPEPLYQDDPTLAKGKVKQIDFAAAGANVSFTRQVVKDGKVIISDMFLSNFRPWQAVYLRGTQE